MFMKITGDRSGYLSLLLEADEDEAMLGRYLDSGTMYALTEDGVTVCIAIVVMRGQEAELMNIAVPSCLRGRGHGSNMLSCIIHELSGRCTRLIVGTGDASPARRFYERNGFRRCGIRKGFFLQYDHPVVEDGRRLVDMVMYSKDIR